MSMEYQDIGFCSVVMMKAYTIQSPPLHKQTIQQYCTLKDLFKLKRQPTYRIIYDGKIYGSDLLAFQSQNSNSQDKGTFEID